MMMKSLRIALASIALMALLATLPDGVAGQEPGPIRWEPYLLEVGEDRVDTVELGRLRVPERRGAGESGTIGLGVVRLPSRSPEPGSPIVYLDGGPGASGVGVARIPEYHRLFDRLRDVADVILLSQRGTGLSEPRLGCGLVEPLPADLFTTRARMLESLAPSVAACGEAWRRRGTELAGYTTAESADDLDALRRALGAERLSLVGFSYGTHLGLSALRRHGDRIERAVLIGTEGPDHTFKLPETYDRQLARLSRLAAADEDGAAATPDLAAAVDTLVRRLDREPVPLEVRSGDGVRTILLGGDGMRYLLQEDMGDTNDHPVWPAAIRLALEGDFALVGALAGRRFGEIRGVPLMGLLMDCASGSTAERLALIRAQEPGSTIGAMTNLWFPEICDTLPEARLPAEFRAPFVSDVPTLFVSGTLDANTPPAQAREVSRGWPRATHVVVERAGHESMMPHPAVQAIIVDFLAGRDVAGRTVDPLRLDFISVERARGLVRRR